MTDPAPSLLPEHAVPADLDELLSPRWLSAALGHPVIDTTLVDSSATLADKIRFRATIRTPDGSLGSRSYCAKSDLNPAIRGGGFVTEARVYQNLLPNIKINKPGCHYTGTDPESQRAIILLDDIIATGGQFLDPRTPYTPATAAACLRELARLHATTWGTTGVEPYRWLPWYAHLMAPHQDIAQFQQLLDDGRCEGFPAALTDARRVLDMMTTAITPRQECVVHGDTHSGNVYLDADGQVNWIDWQVTQLGGWARDVAYHIATVLDPDDRRAYEKSLLHTYLDTMSDLGVPVPDWDTAWNDYILALPYAYYMWAVTRISARHGVLIHMARIAAALDDHDVIARTRA